MEPPCPRCGLPSETAWLEEHRTGYRCESGAHYFIVAQPAPPRPPPDPELRSLFDDLRDLWRGIVRAWRGG